jgi:hypothetical protein
VREDLPSEGLITERDGSILWNHLQQSGDDLTGLPTGRHPLRRTLQRRTPALAPDESESVLIDVVQFIDLVVTRVAYVPDALILGADEDTRRISVVNHRNGVAVEAAALQFNAGINGVAFDEALLILDGSPAARSVAQGDVLEFRSVVAVGTGLADPGGLILVEIARN